MAYARQTWTTRWGRNLLVVAGRSRADADLVAQRLDYIEAALAVISVDYSPQVWSSRYGRSLLTALSVSAAARDAMCIRLDHVEAGLAACSTAYAPQAWRSQWGRSLVGAWPTSSVARTTTCQRLDHIEVGLVDTTPVAMVAAAATVAVSRQTAALRAVSVDSAAAVTAIGETEAGAAAYVCVNPLYEATFNDGLPSNLQQDPDDPPHITRETTPDPWEGSHYGQFVVHQGDVAAGGERAEHRTAGDFFARGQEAWTRQRIRIPDSGVTLTASWRLVTQLHTSGGSPTVALFLMGTGADIYFRVGHGNGSRTDWNSPTISRNVWYDLTIHFLSDSAANGGFVEVWFSEAGDAPILQQLLPGGTGTRKTVDVREQDGGGENYLKWGLYRGSPGTIAETDVVHQDATCVASSQTDVGL